MKKNKVAMNPKLEEFIQENKETLGEELVGLIQAMFSSETDQERILARNNFTSYIEQEQSKAQQSKQSLNQQLQQLNQALLRRNEYKNTDELPDLDHRDESDS